MACGEASAGAGVGGYSGAPAGKFFDFPVSSFFPHQRHLGGMMPARGAYCCRVDLGKSSADA
jgi:hypothetical protein